MILRSSPHAGNATLDDVLRLAEEAKGPDTGGYRTEFVELVVKAKGLRSRLEPGRSGR